MNETTLNRVMYGLIAAGLLITGSGVIIAVFTDTAINNPHGIAIIAGLIAGGLFLSIPAKIYLTLQLMKYNDERLRAQRQAADANNTPK